MVMKKDGRKRDIKSKLVAAICMLLVSCIMMVSSTYAWFTLSTAPEVTGITTAIGANGNLEMALLPYTDGTNTYDSIAAALAAIGTSTSGTATVVEKNTTWGNLVDLSNEGYGLGNISLYPSKLNVADDATALNLLSLLQIPTYGADGRVNGMSEADMNGIFTGTAFNEGGYGVRVVGTSSGMSEREKAYRSALSAASTAATNANKAASLSMAEGGTSLASIAMDRALKDKDSFTQAEVTALKTTYQNMLVVGGPIDLIETALKEYIVASYLAGATTADATAYTAVATAIRNSTLEELTTTAADQGVTLPSGVDTAISTLVQAKVDIDAEITKLNGLTGETVTWDQLSPALGTLGSTSTMLIKGKTLDYWQEKDPVTNDYLHVAELANGGITATMADGIYVTMANYCGTVNATITIKDVSVSGINIGDVDATMTAAPTVSTTYLDSAKSVIMTAGFTSSTSGTDSTPISNFYGYIIDMAFRTNAADSYLQLQTDAIDRIYEENTANEATMGGGSTMSFNVNNNEGYGAESIEKLMGCIRVVFFDPADGTILGYARLDAESQFVDAEGNYTMDLRLWDNTTNTWKADVSSTDADESKTLLSLGQNEATAVSALVYLDGETLTNADVAYDSNIEGTMNLQFSSSASLKPMEYDDLMVGGDEETSSSSTAATTVPATTTTP